MDIEETKLSSKFRSLATAKEWIVEHTEQDAAQFPFLIMAVQESSPKIETTWHSFYVNELLAFVNEMALEQAAMATPGSNLPPPTFNELLPANSPCKTYAEFDFKKFDEMAKWGANTRAEMVDLLEHMLERFIDQLLRLLNAELVEKEMDVVLTREADVVILSAHKESKWSVHVIIDPPIEQESVVWNSTVDCGNFIMHVLAEMNEPLAVEAIDEGVYSDNHTLRIYRAAKVGEPERILRDASALMAPYDDKVMRRSLVSCLRFDRSRLNSRATNIYRQTNADEFADGVTQMVFLSSMFVSLFKPFDETTEDDKPWQGLTYFAPSTIGRLSRARVACKRRGPVIRSDLVTAICECSQLSVFEPRPAFTELSSSYVTIGCDTRMCGIRKGEHGTRRGPREQGSRPVYLALDMVNLQWRQLCWSHHCDNSTVEWRPMDSVLADLCKEYLLNESESCQPAVGAARVLFGKPKPVGV
jgi:hypothetical protein